MPLILTLLLSSADGSTLRDWWRGFCEQHLIATDPLPYADVPTEMLLWSLESGGRDQQVLAELEQRLQAGRLTWADRERLGRVRE
jgi:hypothetical protein